MISKTIDLNSRVDGSYQQNNSQLFRTKVSHSASRKINELLVLLYDSKCLARVESLVGCEIEESEASIYQIDGIHVLALGLSSRDTNSSVVERCCSLGISCAGMQLNSQIESLVEKCHLKCYYFQKKCRAINNSILCFLEPALRLTLVQSHYAVPIHTQEHITYCDGSNIKHVADFKPLAQNMLLDDLLALLNVERIEHITWIRLGLEKMRLHSEREAKITALLNGKESNSCESLRSLDRNFCEWHNLQHQQLHKSVNALPSVTQQALLQWEYSMMRQEDCQMWFHVHRLSWLRNSLQRSKQQFKQIANKFDHLVIDNWNRYNRQVMDAMHRLRNRHPEFCCCHVCQQVEKDAEQFQGFVQYHDSLLDSREFASIKFLWKQICYIVRHNCSLKQKTILIILMLLLAYMQKQFVLQATIIGLTVLLVAVRY